MSKKSPQLRFDGFTDDWEERKLSELIQKGGSGGTPKSTNKTYYDGDIPFLGISDISKSNGYIDDTEKHISEKGLNNSSAWIVPKGAISLAMYASVGKLAILNTDAATSQAFYNMVFEYESIRDYVYHRLGRANDLGEWTKLISTGTQANLNADKVKNFEIQVPQSIDEMKDISTFFNQLDIFITLQQRKLDLLKEQKKGYLQKMFPKNGEKIPELRFAGFADDWEERKLGDEVTFFSGLTYSPDNIVESGSTLVLRSSNVKNGEIVDADNVYVENEAVNSDNVQVGDVIVVVRNGSRNLIGKHAQIKKEMDDTVIGAFMTGVRSDTPYFINALLDTEQFTREIYKNLGATINQITTGAFKKMQFVVPKNKTEKEQIGNFFNQIDDTIALHQRKLDLLKEQKKGFLEKMFV